MKTPTDIAATMDLDLGAWPTVPGPRTLELIRGKIAEGIEIDRAQGEIAPRHEMSAPEPTPPV